MEQDSDEPMKWLGAVADGADIDTLDDEDWPDQEELEYLEIDED